MTPAIRALHRRDPRWNLAIALFYAMWLCAAAVAITVPSWPVRIAAYFLAGATLQGLGILMHEGVHYLLARDRRINHWLGFAAGLPTLLSITSYRVGHLPHHRHERSARDPDELENLTRNPRTLTLLFALTLLCGELFGFYRVGPWNAARVRGSERNAILLEYGIIVAVFTVAFVLLPFRWMLHGWIAPAVVALRLTNVRTLAEHVLTAPEDRLTVTRTVTSNRIVSFLMCNLNYHTAHHLYPGVPWYNLPRLHAILADDFARRGVQVYRSYIGFLLDLGRFALRALGPNGAQVPLVLRTGRA